MKGDPRNYLYVQYAKYLERYLPRLFVFENVLGLKSAGGGIYLNNMWKRAFEKGYDMELFTVEANNFGVLQNRRRVLIIGWKKDRPVQISDLESIRSVSGLKVKSIFTDLPKLKAGEGLDKSGSYRTKIKQLPRQLLNSKRHRCSYATFYKKSLRSGQKNLSNCCQQMELAKERLNYNDLPEDLKTHTNRHSFTDRFKGSRCEYSLFADYRGTYCKRWPLLYTPRY